MRFAFIEAEKARFPVQLMCKVLEVSKAGYYAWTMQSRIGWERQADGRYADLRRAGHNTGAQR